MKVLLVRHGETIENTKHILQGCTPGTLTDEGRRQADATGRELRLRLAALLPESDNPVPKESAVPEESAGLASLGLAGDASAVQLLSSDLQRCKDTTAIINAHLHLPVEYTPLLRERDWGSITGMVVDGITKVRIPGDAETVSQMKARARQFLNFAASHHKASVVIAVSHGLFCRCLQAVHRGVEIADVERMHNGEIREIILR